MQPPDVMGLLEWMGSDRSLTVATWSLSAVTLAATPIPHIARLIVLELLDVVVYLIARQHPSWSRHASNAINRRRRRRGRGKGVKK